MLKKEMAAHSEVLAGSLVEKIIDCPSGKVVGLMKLSTHGRSGIGRWLHGGVVDRVLCVADRPVLLVKSSA